MTATATGNLFRHLDYWYFYRGLELGSLRERVESRWGGLWIDADRVGDEVMRGGDGDVGGALRYALVVHALDIFFVVVVCGTGGGGGGGIFWFRSVDTCMVLLLPLFFRFAFRFVLFVVDDPYYYYFPPFSFSFFVVLFIYILYILLLLLIYLDFVIPFVL